MAEGNPAIIRADQLHTALVAAGVVRADERIRRIVIDAEVGCPVVMHIQRFGDTRLLDVVTALDGVQVHCGEPTTT